MATQVLRVDGTFPAGTSVTAYAVHSWDNLPTTGTAGLGAAITSTTVAANSTVTLAGLSDAQRYVVYGQVGGAHKYLRFTADTEDEENMAADGEWTVDFASGLDNATFAKAYLGTLNDELYLFGSAGESAGAMAGVWKRASDGTWTEIIAADDMAQKDFNGQFAYGAVEFQGDLYMGDRRIGELFRLDLTAPASLEVAAQVGAEDILLGPVLDDKLWMGTFGNPGVPSNAELYTFDGTDVVLVKDFTDLGAQATVTSIAVYDGRVWCTVENYGQTEHQVWAINPDDSAAELIDETGAQGILICAWNGELWAARRGTNTSISEICVYRDGAFVTQASYNFGSSMGLPTAFGPFGDRLFAHSLRPFTYGYDSIRLDPIDDDYLDGNYYPLSMAFHDGHVFVTTNQPVRVYRKRVGTDRLAKAMFRAQNSAAGYPSAHNPTP